MALPNTSARPRSVLNRIASGMVNVWVYLVIMAGLGAVVAGLFPELVVRNAFLRSFLPSDYLPMLIILVTVTLASIVSIHVRVTGMMKSEGEKDNDNHHAVMVRKKANHVAYFLLVLPLAALVLLIVDGFLEPISLSRAWTFCGMLALFLSAIAATYEVQKVVMSLSEMPDRR